MPKYEIAVYNAAVRARVEDGRHHHQLSDEWAETRYIEITAVDDQAAWAKARTLYGESNGYVIEAVSLVTDDWA